MVHQAWFPRSLFGTHVAEGAQQVAALGRFSSGKLSQFPYDGSQTLPGNVLHRVEVDGTLTADGKDWNDVRMMELRCRLGLVLETLQAFFIQSRSEGQNFQGHVATKRDLHRLVDNPHTATTDFSDEAIITK